MKPAPKLESRVPIPPKFKHGWAAVIRSMTPGQSFTVNTEAERNQILRSAQHHRLAVTSRKLNGSGYRIWKL